MTDTVTTRDAEVSDWLCSEALRRRLVRLCVLVVRDVVVAEDLAQEALLEAWRSRDRCPEPGSAEPWVNAIARNVCRRWLRARRASPMPVESVDVSTGDITAVLEHEELVELLDRALGLLPDPVRQVLVCRYVEERSHAEIADRLGTSVDAVSMRLTRARRHLRLLLETRFADDAVAEGWVLRHECGWRSTRLRCLECGRPGVTMRRDRTEVAFRCPACDGEGLSVRLPVDTPVFGRMLAGIRRPSAIAARAATWSLDYWRHRYADPVAGSTPRATCVRCGRAVTVRRYVREELAGWSSRHGWYADCSCGEQVSGSIAGVAAALAEVRAARRREPRLRCLPVRDAVWCGSPAKVVRFGTPDGAEVAHAVFLADTLRLVQTSGPPVPSPAESGRG